MIVCCVIASKVSYEEEDTCMSYEEDTCMPYEEEDTCIQHEYTSVCIHSPHIMYPQYIISEGGFGLIIRGRVFD